jgi:uncharacterized membrane protein HdeD (DUF308 family)
MSECTPEIVWQASAHSMRWGVSLIVFGLLAEWVLSAAVAVNLVIACLIFLAGMTHLIIARHADRGGLLCRITLGFAYALFGVYLIASPVPGLVSLTSVLAVLFLFEGIFDLAVFFRLPARRSSWVLLNGVVTLTLGLMIYLQWPSSARWAIGMLLGVSLVTSGVTRVILTLTARNAIAPVRGGKNREDSSAAEYWRIHS